MTKTDGPSRLNVYAWFLDFSVWFVLIAALPGLMRSWLSVISSYWWRLQQTSLRTTQPTSFERQVRPVPRLMPGVSR
jgi:hypothetical protein